MIVFFQDKYKKLKKLLIFFRTKKSFWPIILLVVIGTVFVGVKIVESYNQKNQPQSINDVNIKESDNPSSSVAPTSQPSTAAYDSSTTVQNSSIPSLNPSPVSAQSPSPSPVSIRIPYPPKINISYPAEGQSITMDTTQTLCLVDVPAGGNTQGVQRKHKLNNQNWTGYVTIYTLCFDPQEGTNTIQLQYKNNYDDESEVYTRNFQFHRLQDININVSGKIFKDENCNGQRDDGETNIDVSASMYLFEIPSYVIWAQFSSNSDGTFSYSLTKPETYSVVLKPLVTSPEGYKANPNWSEPNANLDKSNSSFSVDYPQVPNENVGNCQ